MNYNTECTGNQLNIWIAITQVSTNVLVNSQMQGGI
jgi:hypothetical protein